MNYITAIDLGTTKVVGLVGERTPYGCKVIAYSERPSQGVMRGEVVNIQNVLNAITPCIEELRQKTEEKISQVYVGIAGQHIRSRAESNVITREQVTEEITWDEIHKLKQNMYKSRLEPGEEILHVIPQCYHVDDYMEISDPVGMMGKKIEANYRLFIGRTISAEHTKRCIERAGLRLEQLILEPLASAKAVLTDDEKELGVAMVDIGGGTTDLLIYHNHVVRHAAVIPFGGNVITEDIRQGCGISQRLAEQMKIQYGSCYSDLAPANKTIIMPGIGGRDPREISFKTLANIIEARVSEIMDAVLYEIQNSGYADKLQAGMVLTGGGALLTHLPQYVCFKTGLDARIAKPLLDTDSCPEIRHGAYSCAAGLLLKGIEHQDAKKEAKSEPVWAEVFKPEPPAGTAAKAQKPPKPPKPPKPSKPPIWERLFADLNDNQA
ncbi:MAG: cell division protein FtsA [Bacteroidales bacterium]|nr:cell division protein FtsA [Bacteroidales bacterium]MCL2738516.1 cell division protein FtsA [Bacteroidales bacterium]